MEKIESQAIIGLLKKNRQIYNKTYSGYLINYPGLDQESVSGFLIRGIAPVLEGFEDYDESVFERIFSLLFEKVLEFSGTFYLKKYWNECIEAVVTLLFFTEVVAENPENFIKSFFTAVKRMLDVRPESFTRWIDLIRQTGPLVESTDVFLSTARMAAWVCGVSFLREKVFKGSRLPDEIASSLLRDTGVKPETMEESLKYGCPWFSQEKSTRYLLKFRKGGFRGDNGNFMQPPSVCLVDGHFLCTDGDSVFAVIADSFGSSLYGVSGIDPGYVLNLCDHSEKLEIPFYECREETGEFSDIRSAAWNDSTLVLSRDTSHYIYIYGRVI